MLSASALCNCQSRFRAFGKSFVLSILRLRSLIPFRLCRRLLPFFVNFHYFSRLLLPHTHFHCLLTSPTEGFPLLLIPVCLADPSVSPNWPNTSVPYPEDNLTWALIWQPKCFLYSHRSVQTTLFLWWASFLPGCVKDTTSLTLIRLTSLSATKLGVVRCTMPGGGGVLLLGMGRANL